MVITKLMGGLGNQLFQYAFGKHIAIKNNRPLKFDLSFFKDNPTRKYGLHHFSIAEAAATAAEIEQLKQQHFSKLNTYKRKLLKTKSHFVHEKGPLFNPEYFALQKDVYIDGYWQSEKYFADVAEAIRAELQFSQAPSAANRQMLGQIAQNNAISMHIRRGDYINSEHSGIHGVCAMSYYTAAVGTIVGKVANPVFYVFSDDMEWVKLNLGLLHPAVFVDINNNEMAYEDMRLMSNCKHHIIANSSFSWWGAWLNPRADKIVIAPKQWYNNAELNAEATAITPDSWIRL